MNFDYRGVDTTMEEFTLFTAVTGVVVLLRRERDESQVEPPAPASVDRSVGVSDAVHALCLVLVAPVVVLDIYIVAHGQLTPGGGFQCGIIMASALILIFLGGEYATLRKVGRQERGEIADALGAAGFVVIGFAWLVVGGAFLQTVVSLGSVGLLYSAGTIPLINLSIGLEVMGGLLVVISAFLEHTLQVRADVRARRAARRDNETHAADARHYQQSEHRRGGSDAAVDGRQHGQRAEPHMEAEYQ
jgi:multicomponent Na+:H+ antiporter subunit B